MGRSSQSAVDADGIGIWMAEYFRYSSSGCDHATASQKVLTQVDGNPAPETCLAQCVYRVPSGVGRRSGRNIPRGTRTHLRFVRLAG